MSDTKESLIEREDRQLKLLNSAEMDRALFCSEETAGEYTAENLFRQYPERYRAAVSFLAEGIGILRIARLLRMSPSSIIAIREREPRNIEIEKKRLSRLSRDLASLCVEAAVDRFGDIESLKKMSLKEIGILYGIMVERSELLSGGPTARIAHEDQAPGHSDLLQYLAQLKERSAMGSSGEICGQKDGKVIDITDEVRVAPAANVKVQEPAGSPVSGDGVVDQAPGSGGPSADYVSDDSTQKGQQNEGKV